MNAHTAWLAETNSAQKVFLEELSGRTIWKNYLEELSGRTIWKVHLERSVKKEIS